MAPAPRDQLFDYDALHRLTEATGPYGVGQFQLSGTKSWSLQTFSAPFPATPRLFLTLQSANDSDTVIARAKLLDEDSFKAALFEQQSYQNGHPTETVGYLAVYSPTTSG